MGQLLLKFLAWPWLWSQYMSEKHVDSARNLHAGSLVALSILILLFILLKIGKEKYDWPKFFVATSYAFTFFMLIAVIGHSLNLVTYVANGNHTPTMGGVNIPSYTTITEHTNLYWIGDYIDVGQNKFLLLLFPFGQASPADLLVCFGMIFAWWITLLIVGWVLWHVMKRGAVRCVGFLGAGDSIFKT